MLLGVVPAQREMYNGTLEGGTLNKDPSLSSETFSSTEIDTKFKLQMRRRMLATVEFEAL